MAKNWRRDIQNPQISSQIQSFSRIFSRLRLYIQTFGYIKIIIPSDINNEDGINYDPFMEELRMISMSTEPSNGLCDQTRPNQTLHDQGIQLKN
jgi:hypothetical protein